MGTADFEIYSEYTTDCWYKHMLKFMDANLIEINEDFPGVPLFCGRGFVLDDGVHYRKVLRNPVEAP